MKISKLFLLMFVIPFLYSYTNAASVQGTVTDSITGNAVFGARVQLAGNSPSGNGYETITDENGFYQLTGVESNTYQLIVFAPGYDLYIHPSLLVLDENSNLTVDIQLLPPNEIMHHVSGKVIDSETNLPIADALIELNGALAFPYYVQTDAEGNYDIPAVVEGTYQMLCSKEYYETFEIVELVLDKDTTIDISLIATVTSLGVITGHVYNDADGTPVEGAFIDLIPLDSLNYYYFRSVTDAEGNYEITAPTGEYYVSMMIFVNPSITPYLEYFDDVHSIELATSVAVLENQTTPNINFGVPEPEVISITLNGKVTDDQNNALENAIVEVFPNLFWSDSLIAITSNDGNYSLSFSISSYSNPFEFIVSSEKEGYFSEYYLEKATFFEADILSVIGDTVLNDINFTLSEDNISYNNSISGNVTNELGEPIQDGMVMAFTADSIITPMNNTVAFTDSLGNYILDRLADTEYYIFFAAQSYVPEFYDNVFTWEEATPILANGNIQNINAELAFDSSWVSNPANGSIVGIIKDEGNSPVSNVIITLRTQNGTVLGSAITNSNGDYNINVSNANSYEMIITKVGYVSQSSSFEFDPQQQTTYLLNFTLPQSPTDVEIETAIPSTIVLYNNYPNPFNPSTTIKFQLPKDGFVTLKVYDVLGSEVTTLVNEKKALGEYEINFNANNLASGIYIYKLNVDGFFESKKMILLQ